MIAVAIIFLSLGIDTFAVALGLGLSGLPRSRWLRVGITFACFEGLMPLIGLLVGERLGPLIGGIATYVAAIILIVIGGLELREAFTDKDDDEDEAPKLIPDGMQSLLLLGLSVSLDELAVGFALGVLRVLLGLALGYIALQTLAVTFLGLLAGQRLGERLKERAELVAGLALTLLGLALLLSELTGTHFL